MATTTTTTHEVRTIGYAVLDAENGEFHEFYIGNTYRANHGTGYVIDAADAARDFAADTGLPMFPIVDSY